MEGKLIHKSDITISIDNELEIRQKLDSILDSIRIDPTECLGSNFGNCVSYTT